MDLFISILFWTGVIFLADGALGLIFEDKWRKMATGINIRRLALIEIGTALSLLCVHFLLLHLMG